MTTYRFQCANGHVYETSTGPIRFSYATDKQVLASGPMCPTCMVEWVSRTFPVVEIARIETNPTPASVTPFDDPNNGGKLN